MFQEAIKSINISVCVSNNCILADALEFFRDDLRLDEFAHSLGC